MYVYYNCQQIMKRRNPRFSMCKYLGRDSRVQRVFASYKKFAFHFHSKKRSYFLANLTYERSFVARSDVDFEITPEY